MSYRQKPNATSFFLAPGVYFTLLRSYLRTFHYADHLFRLRSTLRSGLGQNERQFFPEGHQTHSDSFVWEFLTFAVSQIGHHCHRLRIWERRTRRDCTNNFERFVWCAACSGVGERWIVWKMFQYSMSMYICVKKLRILDIVCPIKIWYFLT